MADATLWSPTVLYIMYVHERILNVRGEICLYATAVECFIYYTDGHVRFEGNESSDRGSQEPGGVCGEGSR